MSEQNERLARIETTLEQQTVVLGKIEQHLETATVRDGVQNERLACVETTVKTHSKVGWAFCAALIALLVDKVGGLFR